MIEFSEESIEVSRVELDYPLALLTFYTRINVELDKLAGSISSDKDTLKDVRKIIDKEMSLIVSPFKTITIK